MHALQYLGENRPQVTELPVPSIGPDEVLGDFETRSVRSSHSSGSAASERARSSAFAKTALACALSTLSGVTGK